MTAIVYNLNFICKKLYCAAKNGASVETYCDYVRF